MAMIAKIKRMYFREKLNISEIARRTSLTRNTVKAWLHKPEGSEPAYQRKPGTTLLTPYVEQLRQALETDSHRPKRERRTALRLYAEIKAKGFTGSYTRVSEFVRKWRMGLGGPVSFKPAYVPLKFALGEAFQFDWSEENQIIGGIYRKILVAHVKLCASRAFLLIAYPSQSHEMLFDAHTRAFRAFGGIPRRGIYDNMKTAVDRVQKGKGRIVNTRFSALLAHYLFDADFCNVASGWEKGVVEKNVQDSRRRIWQDARNLRFGSFSELNAWLETRSRQLWGELSHTEHPGLTVAEVLELEQPHLMPMVSPFDGYVEVLGRVSTTCLVTVQRNRYSVPCRLVGQMISARIYPSMIVIHAEQEQVACHARVFDHGQTRYDWQHYVPLIEKKPGALGNGAPFADMPAPLQKLRTLLLKREGGDRAMAQVLGTIPRAGLEAVLVAVELALESGVASSGHVLNLLARLNQTPPPASVESALAIAEPPLADTGRYDRLHTKVSHD